MCTFSTGTGTTRSIFMTHGIFIMFIPCKLSNADHHGDEAQHESKVIEVNVVLPVPASTSKTSTEPHIHVCIVPTSFYDTTCTFLFGRRTRELIKTKPLKVHYIYKHAWRYINTNVFTP